MFESHVCKRAKCGVVVTVVDISKELGDSSFISDISWKE